MDEKLVMHDLHPMCGPEATWEWDYWFMRCMLMVRADDDGTLFPNVDFVGPSDGQDPRITCELCKNPPKPGELIEEKEEVPA